MANSIQYFMTLFLFNTYISLYIIKFRLKCDERFLQITKS